MSDPSQIPSPATTPRFLINRDFALLWGGQAISTIGDTLFDTTLILWISTRLAQGQPWAPLAVSGVLLAAALPTAVAGPLAGVFVDRWDKRWTMLWMDALRAALILLLVPLADHRLPVAWQLGTVYGVVALATVCAQLFTPARVALVGDIVAEPMRAHASGLQQVVSNLALVVGPPLAAPLFFGLGVRWALVANALSFVASFGALLALYAPPATANGDGAHEPQGDRWGALREFGAGLRLCATSRILRTLIMSAVLIALGSGALFALLVFFVAGNLHASAGLYGVLVTALGAGSVAGAALAGLGARRVGVARTFWLSLVALGALTVAFARLTSAVPAVAVMVVLGVPRGGANVALMPLLLHGTPRAFVGRVVAVLNPAVSVAEALSIALAGYLASTTLRGWHAALLGVTLGPIDTILSGAGILMTLGGLYAFINLRDVRLDADPG